MGRYASLSLLRINQYGKTATPAPLLRLQNVIQRHGRHYLPSHPPALAKVVPGRHVDTERQKKPVYPTTFPISENQQEHGLADSHADT